MDVIAPPVTEIEKATKIFAEERSRLLHVAYRTVGSVSEAEDIVQDAWLKWQHADRAVVRNPAAFLTTTTTRIAINTVMSARHRHESYTDPQDLEWLGQSAPAQPDDSAEQNQAVEHAVLLLLQTLTPKERAAYLLHEAFDYPYRQIAEVLTLSTVYARQLVVRARQGIASRPRRPVAGAAHKNLLTAFRAAANTGNLGALEHLLATDASE